MKPNEILKKLRESRNLTMKDVSLTINMATSLISDYETGKKALGMKVAIRFADFYNVSLDYLLGRPEAKPPEKPIDEFAGKENLKELEKILIERYLKLTDVQRETILDFLRECVAEEEKRKQILEKDIQESEIDEETLKIMRETEAKKASLLALLSENENL